MSHEHDETRRAADLPFQREAPPYEIEDRYRIERPLGKGGMGEVYLGWDRKLNRPVAIKLLPRKLGSIEDKDRFRREVFLTANLNHPSIVSVHDTGTLPDGRPYYVMAHITGRGLDRILFERLHNQNVLLRLLEDTARTVHFAHQKGVLHRDLKPSNIIVDDNLHAHLLDWGIARTLTGPPDAGGESVVSSIGLTSSGMVLGTLEYMSPEQARGELSVLGPRSDVYSLGAILYDILTGVPPVTGKTGAQLLRAVQNPKFNPPRDRNTSVPRDLEAICLRALEPNLKNRYSSALELAEDLLRFRSQDPVAARPLPLPKRIWRKARKHGRIVFPLVGALLASLSIALWGITRAVDRTERIHDLTEKRTRESQALLLVESAQEGLIRTLLYASRPNPDPDRIRRHLASPVRKVDEAIRLAPGLASAHYLRGRLWELAGDDARAEESWRHTISLNTEFGRAFFRLGRLYVMRSFSQALLAQTVGRTFSERTRDAARIAQSAFEAAAQLETDFNDGFAPELQQALMAYADGTLTELRTLDLTESSDFEDQEGAEDLYWLAALGWEGSRRRALLDESIALHPSVPALLLRSRERLNRKDRTGALQDVSWALGLAPRDPALHVARAVLRIDMSDSAGALSDLETALSLHPDLPEALTIQGEIYLKLGDIARALVCFEQALSRDHSLARAFSGRGSIHTFSGRFVEALADLRAALKIDPTLATAHRDCATAHLGLGDYDAAVESASAAIERDPTMPQPWHDRAIALLRRGHAADAIPDFNRACAMNPQNTTLILERGNAWMEQNRLDQAAKDFRDALELDPLLSKAHESLGVCLLTRGSFTDAVATLTRALELDPASVKAYLARAAAHRSLGNLDTALADCSAALQRDPDSMEAFYSRGVTCFLMKKYPEAAWDFSDAIRLGHPGWRVYDYRSTARRKLADNAGAVDDAREAVRLAPAAVQPHMTLAKALDDLGEKSAAADSLARAIQLDPGALEAYYERAAILTSLNRIEEAIRDYESILTLAPPDWPRRTRVEEKLTVLRNVWEKKSNR